MAEAVKITFRPVTEADYDFLYDLHRAAMRDYVVQTFGQWDEDWQQSYFRLNFRTDGNRVIQIDGKDVGVIALVEDEDRVFIANIELLPAYQGKGIGGRVLRSVIAGAGEKTVTLQVFKVNPARKLYERLGFAIYGETETSYQMKYR